MPLSTNIGTYSDNQLLNRVQQLESFTTFPNKGKLDIWIRSKEDAFDRFDDKVYTFDCNNTAPKFVAVTSGTSNCGSHALKHFKEYNPLGAAVLKSDYIVLYSHRWGLHHNKYPAYIQDKSFPYYRDNDYDNLAEELGDIHWDMIGANCHHAGDYSTIVKNWSDACLVRNILADYNNWMQIMNHQPLSVCILKEF